MSATRPQASQVTTVTDPHSTGPTEGGPIVVSTSRGDHLVKRLLRNPMAVVALVYLGLLVFVGYVVFDTQVLPATLPPLPLFSFVLCCIRMLSLARRG